MTAIAPMPTFPEPEMKNPGFVTRLEAGRGVARGLRSHYSRERNPVQRYLEAA